MQIISKSRFNLHYAGFIFLLIIEALIIIVIIVITISILRLEWFYYI